MSEIMMLTIGFLTTWRITHLLQAEDGPARILVRFRVLFGRGFFGDMLDCFYCLSVWVSLPLAFGLGQSWPERFWLWPTFSGGACLLQKLTEKTTAPALFYEEEEI